MPSGRRNKSISFISGAARAITVYVDELDLKNHLAIVGIKRHVGWYPPA